MKSTKSKSDPNAEMYERIMPHMATALAAFGSGLAGGTGKTTMMVAFVVMDGTGKPTATPPVPYPPFPPPDFSGIDFGAPPKPKAAKRSKAKPAAKPVA